jgi:hypothetical protein
MITAVVSTFYYVVALVDFVFQGTKYDDSKYFKDDKWAKVNIFSLSLIMKMWGKPHYRSSSFQQDMLDNLRNVAIPGTGIPLSIFACNWWVCLFFLIAINPVVCLLGAVNKARYLKVSLSKKVDVIMSLYVEHLLHPNDWFSFWRLNCRLASYHSMLTKSTHYSMEDKWTFLLEGEKIGVPVSPFETDMEVMVVKDKNVEGGMGIHFFKNAVFGGDWILQPKMANDAWLLDLLPDNAPLSTMRVITASTWFLQQQGANEDGHSSDGEGAADEASRYVTALSSVLRLGRANAATDHSSVLFDVDIATGVIRGGLSNAQWYRLGLAQARPGGCPWLPPDVRAQFPESGERVTASQGHSFDVHPDKPGVVITGKKVPNMQAAVDIVVK